MSSERVTITPYRDGPLIVRGPVELCDQDGAPIATDRRVIALCRCGRSRIRPFCDGTHHLIRFRAGSAAEDRSGAGPPALTGRESVSEPEGSAGFRCPGASELDRPPADPTGEHPGP